MSAPQMITLEQATWAWIESGPKKHKMALGVRFCKAFLAGIFLSLGATLVQVLSADPWLTLNAPGLLKIIQGAVFPIGLIMIVIFQADLVTASMAIMIMSTVKRKVPYWAFLLDWTIAFVGNLVGALAYAGLIVHFGGIYSDAMNVGAAAGADAKVSAVNFREIFLRGIGCNFSVVAAVFMASLAKDVVSKIFAAYIPIFFFVAAGYDHVVANMFLIPEGLMTGKANFGTGEYIWKSMIASFLGNIVGAAILVLPLVYMHGGDEFDPNNLEVTHIENSSPTGTVSGPQRKSAEWKNDIERSAAS
ncbi:hypothetical protein CBS101457_003754 [Exobasidium rhododendri]|nr:hypothetical protein CBS101457_003754 [Exobasidium rhododendri]